MLILLLISIPATVLSVAIYRRHPTQLAMRLIAIGLMCLLVTNYTLRIPSGEKQRSPFVLIDYSSSMASSLPTILDAVRKIEFPHELYFISESLLTETEPRRLGSYTDISTAITQAATMQPSFLLLVSDGNHNFGTSPLASLDGLNIPVFVCGVGDEAERDGSIIDVDAPAYAYPGDSTAIEVTVESGGYTGGNGWVTLNTASGENIDAQMFPLSGVTAKSRLTFWYIPRQPGTATFNIEMEPLADEISYANNESTISLSVLEEKIKVLYYTDHVSFNTKFILEALALNTNMSVSPLVRKGPGKYSRLLETSDDAELPDITAFDVVILDNANVRNIPWRHLPELLNNGMGIVLIGQIEDADEQWRRIMPINTTGSLQEGKHEIEVIETFSVLTVGNYPPARSMLRTVGSKHDATIIARSKDLPVIGFRRNGKGRVFQICIDDLGTWSFLLQGIRNTDLMYDLVSDIVRFLSPRGTQTRLVLRTERWDYQIGENMQLSLQSYDRDFRRTGGGDFFLIVGDSKVPFYEVRRGIYESSTVLREEGTHDIFAKGELDGERLTSNTVEVNIIPRSDEAEHMLNRTLLELIAARTKGKYLLLKDLHQIEPLSPARESRLHGRMVNLNSPVVYLAVLIMLVVDWILRRRRGVT
ncbi:MAG: VWA domain-containing protein [candidate division WOR-3 bacterium]|nr:MAG: VWA domain-containing protein [candidate division WOR-3 bacterium]